MSRRPRSSSRQANARASSCRPSSAFRCPAGSTAGLSLQHLSAPPPIIPAKPHYPGPAHGRPAYAAAEQGWRKCIWLESRCSVSDPRPITGQFDNKHQTGETRPTSDAGSVMQGLKKSRSHIIIIRHPGSFQLALRNTREKESKVQAGCHPLFHLLIQDYTTI